MELFLGIIFVVYTSVLSIVNRIRTCHSLNLEIREWVQVYVCMCAFSLIVYNGRTIRYLRGELRIFFVRKILFLAQDSVEFLFLPSNGRGFLPFCFARFCFRLLPNLHPPQISYGPSLT